jgi:ABC-2 type transport system ATP-binding protein
MCRRVPRSTSPSLPTNICRWSLNSITSTQTEPLRRIRQLLALFELTAAADRQIDSYSKGMRQKVLLASALLHEPQVLLLDEPLNGLDVTAARALRQIIEEFAQRGRTVLYTSHILDVVERVCQRVIVLHQGRIVADAPTAELLGLARQGTLEAAFAELTRCGPE